MRHLGLALFIAACGGTDAAQPPDAPVAPDAPTGPSGCPRTAAPDDRPRHVVVSHPYDAEGGQAGGYEVLELSEAGVLSRPNRTFTMGRAVVGTIAFTPDGEVGLAALDNGKLAVFRLDAAGIPTVVHAEFAGSFYASRVVVEGRGDRALILDGNTRENGGGVYLVTIGCDGTITDHGMLAAAKLPGGLAFAGSRALVAAADLLDSPTAGDDVHLLDWSDTPGRVTGVDAFGDDMAIIGGSALTHDSGTFLVGDTSQFSGVPNRVAVVEVELGLHPKLVAQPSLAVEDPQAIVASPFGNVAVVASAFGDALFVLDDAGPSGAWRVRGEVAYTGGSPQLPGDLARIDRGTLRGHVLVSENVSVRQLTFRSDGTVEDLGALAFGSGLQNISGAIGVTP
jgi:hypothetical protein